jgi:hypothetical protein
LQQLIIARNAWDKRSALIEHDLFLDDLPRNHRTSYAGQIDCEKPLLPRPDNPQAEKLSAILFRFKSHWTQAENCSDFLNAFFERAL